ncbi:MAG: hypothetical protein P1U56_17180 [Saprospiraceae bacterium]|nr:hypothetical protein [Saprospiraceae bacterium]
MKEFLQISLLLLFMSLVSCKKTPDFFIGKWKILHVVENKTTSGIKETWMQLKSDGSFESYDGELGKHEKGKWKYKKASNTLIINGSDGENSHWNLSLENDTLYFNSIEIDMYLTSIKTH